MKAQAKKPNTPYRHRDSSGRFKPIFERWETETDYFTRVNRNVVLTRPKTAKEMQKNKGGKK